MRILPIRITNTAVHYTLCLQMWMSGASQRKLPTDGTKAQLTTGTPSLMVSTKSESVLKHYWSLIGQELSQVGSLTLFYPCPLYPVCFFASWYKENLKRSVGSKGENLISSFLYFKQNNQKKNKEKKAFLTVLKHKNLQTYFTFMMIILRITFSTDSKSASESEFLNIHYSFSNKCWVIMAPCKQQNSHKTTKS